MVPATGLADNYEEWILGHVEIHRQYKQRFENRPGVLVVHIPDFAPLGILAVFDIWQEYLYYRPKEVP